MVVAKKRSGCFKSGFPACAAESAVIWCTIASGLAAATASPTDTASSPSITTTPSAPSCSSKPSRAGPVAVAVTWWPRATSCGTSRRPNAPLPPATNTRTTITLLTPELTPNPETRQPRPSVTWGTQDIGNYRAAFPHHRDGKTDRLIRGAASYPLGRNVTRAESAIRNSPQPGIPIALGDCGWSAVGRRLGATRHGAC
jgi:hypothetical protein